MPYLLADALMILAAIAVVIPLLVLPGVAMAYRIDALGFRRAPASDRLAIALVVAFGTMPILTATAARFAGLSAALALTALLAATGVAILWSRPQARPVMPGRFVAMASAMLAALIILGIADIGWNGGLYPSLVSLDMVKHAAVTNALAQSGRAPPIDPFFWRAEPASYYYFFYVPAALVRILGGGLIDARAAVAGLAFWVGIALAALVALLADRTTNGRARDKRVSRPLLIGVLALGGFQVVYGWMTAIVSSALLAQTSVMGDQVTNWALSLLWVPHHVAGTIACWAGFLALASMTGAAATSRSRSVAHVVFAGMAFASAAGTSIWVTFGAVATVGAWVIWLGIERRWRHVGLILAAGLVAIVLAAPHLADMMAVREGTERPLVLGVREFPFLWLTPIPEAIQQVINLVLLPLEYVMEFGLIAIGAVVYWRRAMRSRTVAPADDIARMLAISAVAALLIGGFLRSNIGHNDLGHRVVQFAQIAGAIWTAVLLAPIGERWQRLPDLAQVRRIVPRTLFLAALLGVLTVGWDLIGTRVYQPLRMVGFGKFELSPVLNAELREAYGWLNANIAVETITQHNPDTGRRLHYGLYGRNRVAISDKHNSKLLGAVESERNGRLADITRAFGADVSAADAKALLRRHGADIAVVSSDDPIWQTSAGWAQQTPSIFQSAHVRIVRVRDIVNQTAEARP